MSDKLDLCEADADPNDLHNARVRALLDEIKKRMDRLTEPSHE